VLMGRGTQVHDPVGRKKSGTPPYHEGRGTRWWRPMTPGADPVHKVTIIPARHGRLGIDDANFPEADKHTYTERVPGGPCWAVPDGRVAAPKRFFLGHITTGAGQRTSSAPRISPRNMVLRMGHERPGAGWRRQRRKKPSSWAGKIAQHRDFSEDTALQIDREVKRIVNRGYEAAKSLLSTHKETLGQHRAGLCLSAKCA